MPEPYLVVGAGGHAKVVLDALLASGQRVLGCYDDNPALAGFEPIAGVSVAGPTPLVEAHWTPGRLVIVAVGDNAARRKLASRLHVDFGVARAPTAVLGSGVTLGPGTMVLPSATVNIDSLIGCHAILNTACSIDHDCRIGDYVHIAPGGRLGGGITVGEGSFLGIGASVIPGVRIGRWSIVGAGAVVTADLPDNCTAVGVPAKVIKTRQEGWHLK